MAVPMAPSMNLHEASRVRIAPQTKMQVEQMKERIRASEQAPASKFVAQKQDDDGDGDDDDSEAED